MRTTPHHRRIHDPRAVYVLACVVTHYPAALLCALGFVLFIAVAAVAS